jgi:hypothetical protein
MPALRPVVFFVPCLALAGAPAAQVDAYAYTAEDRLRIDRGSWLDPERVQRIEVEGAADALEAWVGKQAWPLVKDPHKPVHVLVLDARLRRAWHESGTMVVGYPTQRDRGGELTLRASPRRLDLPAAGTKTTLKQRTRAEVVGTGGYLRVAIGDITHGQTLLSVSGADRRAIVEQRSMRAGDHVDVDLGEGRYVLRVEQLHNLLIGDDHAVLALLPAETFERDRIESLLRRIAAAQVTFVREGKDYTPAEAAAHLRRKYEAAKDKVTTLEAFIADVASRSSLTGNAYSIKHADGSSQSAEAWLRAEASNPGQGDAVETGQPGKTDK